MKDKLQREYGGEWKEITLPDRDYGDGICGLGCGSTIVQGETCYELRSKGKLITLLCQECCGDAE
jgi:hypothetical protein